MKVAVILVAAGRGERLGDRGPKALVTVAGRTLLEHAVAGVRAAGLGDIVVVHPPDERDRFAALVADATLVPGGDTRTASVRAGFAAVDDGVEVVAVHDAARALMPADVVRRAVAAITTATTDADPVIAAAPAMPVSDTLKQVAGAEVVRTVDRDVLVAVQTPQVFRRDVLALGLARLEDATDDLALVERLLADRVVAGRVVTVAGSLRGAKITWPDDLLIAEALTRERP